MDDPQQIGNPSRSDSTRSGGGQLGNGPASGHEYRVRGEHLAIGICVVMLFSSFGAFAIVTADGQFNIVMIGIPPLFVLLGLYLIAYFFVHRLEISDSTIMHIGCIRKRELAISSVERLEWRRAPAPGGSVIVRNRATTLRVEFGTYSPCERQQLVSFFRNHFDESMQYGWSRFQPPATERKRTKKVVMAICLPMLAFFAALSLYSWFLGLGARYLLLAIANVAAIVGYCLPRRFLPAQLRGDSEEVVADPPSTTQSK